jgi:ABC-2 type transport system permease protein
MSLVLHDPFSLIFSIVQPLIFLGLFGPLLAGSVNPAVLAGASPLQWFLPGVIVMICLFGTSTAGSNLLFEISLGSYERVLATPIHRSAILIGRSLKELAPLVVQAALITLIAIPFGFRLYPLHVLVGLLLLGVFGVGIGALSNALAIASRKREWMFWAVQQSLLFPLLICRDDAPLEASPPGCSSSARSTRGLHRRQNGPLLRTFADRSIGLAVLAALITCAVGLWVVSAGGTRHD